MSTWTRMALVAAGAAAGALSTRWVTSEQGKRVVGEVVGELAQRSGRSTADRALEGHPGTGATPNAAGAQNRGVAVVRGENRWASRLLRLAQDIKAGSDQRETELRRQLGMATPEQIKARHSALTARRQTQRAISQTPDHDDVIDMD